MRRVISHPPTISDRVDPDIREVITWAIAANPSERPATALQLAERIEALALAPAPD
jgi:eukaryotic-like serine/threonine-protein kinase